MKYPIFVASLAFFASQVMAVVPKNDPNCSKSQIVSLADTGCADFAARHGATFEQLMAYNPLLRKDCLNLDVGHPICVSINPADKCATCLLMPPINFANGTSGWDPASPYYPKGGVSAPAPVPSPATASGAVPSSAPQAATSALSAPSVPTASAAASASANSPKATAPVVAPASDAVSSKASMMLASAGVLLSIAYML
ncbi:hypothetical protein BGZ68_002794 [Mortierella alpina]|nr:hypothetical protein BGZ68_002794 [Mortierella alpina]